MTPVVGILVALTLVFGNAFFVGAEFALISARRSQIEPLARDGSRWARSTLAAMENISLVIGVNQLGITVCSLALGAVAEPATARLIDPVLHLAHVPESFLHPVSFGVALLVVVYLHVLLGEMVPKNIAIAGPERAALALGPPIWALVRLLTPLIRLVNALARGILRVFGVTLMDEISSTFTREEVSAMVEESRVEGLLAEGEYDRLAGALDFSEKTIDSVVMPLDSLASVRRGSTAAEVEELCAATGFSRFPVAAADGDLVGYLHIKDVLDHAAGDRDRVIDDKRVRALATVRQGEVLRRALLTLQRRGAHMGRVAADDGRIVGVVTLEDVIEELVGQIRDGAH
jgi:CBS domain containing-hemolysin-like protein